MLDFGHDPGRSTAQTRPSHRIQTDTTEATQRTETMIEIAVGIVMGSQSDWATMKQAAAVLDELDVRYEAKIVSAHRTPERLRIYGNTAVERGLKVIIAGAGGAAHLPGMMAAHTRLPVLGVPVQSRALSGLDSLYSIVQMPKGVPVGTMAIGAAGAANAGLMAASILAIDRPDLAGRLERWRSAQSDSVAEEPIDE
jgi:5-(carboxyamino)imidazole ribonucleotide mutase